MELRQLQHFIAVAEEGSFTKAARRLRYVQSAISVSVKALEDELGVQLLDRTTHQVVLTGAGKTILPAARRAVASAQETLQLAAAIQGVLRGQLRIRLETGAYPGLPALLGRFHRLHPGVEIQIGRPTRGSASVLEELRAGIVDVAFAGFHQVPAGVAATPLGSEDFILIAAPDLRLPGRGRIRLDELASADFIDFWRGWNVRTVIDQAFATAGLDPRQVSIEAADVSTLLQLVHAGLGIALLPPSLLGTNDRRLTRRPVSPAITWHIVMAMQTDPGPAPAANALAEMVIQNINTQDGPAD